MSQIKNKVKILAALTGLVPLTTTAAIKESPAPLGNDGDMAKVHTSGSLDNFIMFLDRGFIYESEQGDFVIDIENLTDGEYAALLATGDVMANLESGILVLGPTLRGMIARYHELRKSSDGQLTLTDDLLFDYMMEHADPEKGIDDTPSYVPFFV